ncbi:2-oxoacid:ferredoxin oxidoreductase subunit beta [Chrysiogenes arsenatis]|uniref:2-oxoacid:ferredoxin oxidoreductase subunit beta n=1 Tax=Chrysiogenes arsenatis TaxID=309797 RepID=UPI0004195B54|nr:2-oxoacid:ferredoxin oxidoreductase subunit beta [Chrysiogenes arsenatis]
MTTTVNEVMDKNYFTSKAEVKWCPGCGDYAIINSVKGAMVNRAKPRDEVAIVSGIGCSSRFPYYMETYGFHTIHGRAAAIASGLKVGKPDLDVWVISGDGDSTAIGGNHWIHAIRRNINLNYVLINNKIYGLTKGQYSPTSEMGQITKTTPYGVIDYPMNPLVTALGIGGTFVARSIDKDVKMGEEICTRGANHPGFSLMEMYSNCVIFNDGAHDKITGKDKADFTIHVQHGKKLIFGVENNLCLVQDGFRIKMAKVSDVAESAIIVHDETNLQLATLLADMAPSKGQPVALGVIYCDPAKKSYDFMVHEQVQQVIASKGEQPLDKLLRAGDTWTISTTLCNASGCKTV